jgi:phospholipase D-like protein
LSTASFVSNESLWHALRARVKSANHVDAAIAYLGQGAARVLALKNGDRLIVDMSLATVSSGGIDPREVEKLVKRGVHAFTRRNLHAKLVVADGLVICGSANVSKRSLKVLDEAAIVSSDPAVVRRAREFINRLCTEPVRPEYLERSKRFYRPPRFTGGRAKGSRKQHRARHAKVWLVSLYDRVSIPESELERYERGEAKAEKLVRDRVHSRTDSFHWPHEPRMAAELEFGDWIIQVVTHKDKGAHVYAPAQLLYVDNYPRSKGSGKKRWVFHLEVPKRGEAMTWGQFGRRTRGISRSIGSASPRTRPIRDDRVADGLLRLWTMGGRVSRL